MPADRDDGNAFRLPLLLVMPDAAAFVVDIQQDAVRGRRHIFLPFLINAGDLEQRYDHHAFLSAETDQGDIHHASSSNYHFEHRSMFCLVAEMSDASSLPKRVLLLPAGNRIIG